MPIAFGFASLRREQLETELRRITRELPALGVVEAYVVGDLALGRVDVESIVQLVLVHETTEPPHRRADFFISHLDPNVGTDFVVYTPAEFATARLEDPIVRAIVARGVGG